METALPRPTGRYVHDDSPRYAVPGHLNHRFREAQRMTPADYR